MYHVSLKHTDKGIQFRNIFVWNTHVVFGLLQHSHELKLVYLDFVYIYYLYIYLNKCQISMCNI